MARVKRREPFCVINRENNAKMCNAELVNYENTAPVGNAVLMISDKTA